ncbi:MAG: GPMC system MBL fold metallohydrolase [Desulfuromonadales bacterium]
MTDAFLKLTVLGSGTSTGVPVLGCHCAVCSSAEPRNNRTRCSALLEWSGHKILIDTATDLRQQALREGIEQVDSVLYTHAHADHLHGIDDLRTFTLMTGKAIPVYAARDVLDRIQGLFSYVFSESDTPGYRPRLQVNEVNGPFELFGQMVTPLPLAHGSGESLGYRVGNLAYVVDCSAIPESSWALLQGLEVLVIDALRFREHESHFSISAAIEVARTLQVPKTLLTHLTHDVDYPRHSAELPEGVEFAYDGQTVMLPLPELQER